MGLLGACLGLLGACSVLTQILQSFTRDNPEPILSNPKLRVCLGFASGLLGVCSGLTRVWPGV